jgi:hypothetical protein
MTKTIIHIGFAKTGTTFLQKYFDTHPEIFHNRNRFKKYENTGIIDETIHCKVDEFKFDVLSEEHLTIWAGDHSQFDLQKHNMKYEIRAHQVQVAKSLFEFYPNASILITVRAYASLIKTLYSQHLFSGESKSNANFLKENQDLILELYNYDFIIKTYQQLFGIDSVIILPFEFLSENPRSYLYHLESIFNFNHIDFPLEKVHASLSKSSIPIVRILNFMVLHFIKILPKNNRKSTFLSYLEWLNGFKEKLVNKNNVRKENTTESNVLKNSIFHQNCNLIQFSGVLSKYNANYHDIKTIENEASELP